MSEKVVHYTVSYVAPTVTLRCVTASGLIVTRTADGASEGQAVATAVGLLNGSTPNLRIV